jgi:D-glycero-alpha-D-manno-heptose 1-phosphate guanylyltransferase
MKKDAIILCGGLGTRFRSVSSAKPKALAEIKGKPIIEILTDQLVVQGIERIVLCVGYLSNQVIDYYKSKEDAEYIFSIEEMPLGTGGALFNAYNHIKSDYFYALNGDSFCNVDFKNLDKFHEEKKSFFSLVGSEIKDASDYGAISLGEDKQMLNFREKSKSGNSIINAGIYLLPRIIFQSVSGEFPISLEKDIFPDLIKREKCYAYVVPSEVIDIGTKDRYEKAQEKIIF